MGACTSKDYGGSKDEVLASKKIDEALRREKKDLELEVKLLLLGAGESGKSTFTKQMKIIHLKGFNDEEKYFYKEVIFSNVIMAMRSIVLHGMKQDHNPISPNLLSYAQLFYSNEILISNEKSISPEVTEAIKQLWADDGVQELYNRSSEYQLIDSANYFFENIDRISESDYSPTPQDLLMARARTTGITEISFDLGGIRWRVVDVGGQRNERKKWIHCFQGVTALIFCIAMSEYDLKLYEDEKVNRLHETLTLFDEICNCQWFSETSLIILFNKNDLFKEKIKKVDLKVCFPEYTGGCNYDNALTFLKQKVLKLNKNSSKPMYSHVTCATDTEQVRMVFTCVKDIIIRESLANNDLY